MVLRFFPLFYRMEDSSNSENLWNKTKIEEQQADLFNGESTTGSVEANSTSLADIFDTAFSSTVDPSPQSRFTSGNNVCLKIVYFIC